MCSKGYTSFFQFAFSIIGPDVRIAVDIVDKGVRQPDSCFDFLLADIRLYVNVLAKQCEVQVAYAIGVAKPVSIMVDTFGTGAVEDEKIEQAVEKVFDLTPAAIIRDLDLRKPIYRKLAAYGHMGREDLGVKWENTDRVEELKAAVAAL